MSSMVDVSIRHLGHAPGGQVTQRHKYALFFLFSDAKVLVFLSAVSFEAVLLVRERSGFGVADCGKPLVQAARYNASSLPHLRIQNR
jgi:hypothetical protein